MSIKKNIFAPSTTGRGATRRAAMLLLVMLLMMAQTAWAATVKETRTTTWQMDGGKSGSTTLANSLTLLNAEGKRLYYYNTIQDGDNSFSLSTWFGSKTTSLGGNILDNHGELRFTNLEGTVTKVELKNFSLVTSGIQMYVGRDKTNTSTLLHLQGNNSDYDVPSSDNQAYNRSATFEGSIEVSQSNPLKIMFKDDGHDANSQSEFGFENGYITVTYEVEVEVPDPEDPGHTFSFNASGNTLTATCTETASYHHCSLGNSRTSTLTLTADDVPYSEQFYVASLNLGDFIDETGLAVTNGGIVYRNKSTGVERTNGEFEVGDYTVTATIIISGTSYTLTKDFSILAGFKVNNSYSQFSVSKISALEGDEMTITFTPQMGETLDALTLTGATSGNNIAYTQSGNTYTFNMPAEDVNLNATITYPLNENDFAQSEDTYTIKTAKGWNYFCQRLKVDTELNGFSGKTIELAGDITVTTMAGNYDHSFKGTFDGKGHTLTFNYTANMANCAPFCITNGATIRSLHVTGLIQAGNYAYCGGLVGSANGSLTIENCHVSTQISSTINGEAGHGGIVGYVQYTNYLEDCNITGCVFDGLIYNSNTWNQTYGCGGFIGAMSQYAYVDLTDCLFLHGQYDNNGNKCELLWGYDNDRNSTFFHRSNGYGEGKLTNCFYVGTRGLKQGSPAVESADAPDNFAHFGDPTTDYGFLKVYGHTMVFDGKYYTPTYGDLVETYSYSGVKSYIIEYDDAPLGIPAITSPLWTESLRYNRSFTKDKPVTIMLPFNFKRDRITLAGSSENPSGKFYDFKGIDNSGNPIMDEGNEVVENTLQANHPYLYVPAEDTEHWAMYVSDGINIFTQDNGGGTKVTEYDGYELHGTYTEKVWEENDPEIGKAYVYNANGELVPVAAGTKIRPTECYIIQTAWAGTVDVTINVTGSGSVSIGNQTATAGNPFTTSVDDGASVTLTFAPDAGNIVTGAKLSYKFSESGTAEDNIAISGSTATFQMPNDIWNGTGVTINVTFGDGLIGGADEASAVDLTDATVSNLAGGYYKVESDISFDHTLNLIGDTYLVIASGAKMTVSSSEYGINGGSYALNVLGEGTLNVTTTGSYKIAVNVSSYTQLGCSVNLTTTYFGMRCSDSFNISGGSFKTNGSKGIYPNNAVNISGGKLEASNIDANINLSYNSTDDYIKVDTYTSGKTMTIANGQTFTDGTTNYSGTITSLSPLNGKKLFPFVYMHLTVRDATCTEVGIKLECWQRSSDGKYFSDENGTNELNASDVEIPMIAHNGIHHEATDTHIAYWQCSMCSKYFSEEGCTTEITEEDTKIYRTITIDGSISGLVTSNVDKAVAGTTVTLTVSHLIDASTLRVNDGSVALTDAGNGTYTFTVPAADVTVTASTATTYSVNLPANMEIVSATNTADGSGKYISGTVVTFKASFFYTASNVYEGANTLTADDSGNYSVTVGTADITVTATIEHSSNIDLSQAPSDFTVVDGDVLTGSTSHTVTIANGASITLNDATITGGIVCDGTAEITLVGTNSVSGASQKAGIQVGGSGTTLTINGDGSLTANGAQYAAGIGLNGAWKVTEDVIGGNIVINGGNITANGGVGAAGIGAGLTKDPNNSSERKAIVGNITIKGGTVTAVGVKAVGGHGADGIGAGDNIYNATYQIGTVTIYDDIDKVDASSISESVTYMHVDGNTETDVTANASTYFTIIENGNRRIIEKKDDTDYTITIANGIEHGTLTGAATAKYTEKVTITATPDFGYRLSRLVVKDAQNNDVASTGNSFFMPKSNVTVSAVFEQGVHGTTEFAWFYKDYSLGYTSIVKEATIFDGVTTVNLQQGKEYYIGKDYQEDPEPGMGGYENTFRLDEDPSTYGRNIPYSGGTGSFMMGGNGKFRLNGDAGFYDITMTDVGNGKWSVSILKTAGQMDVVPDQTYTGSEITPEPLVIAGSLSLTKGTDYVYSYTNNTNVGTAKVRATFQGTYASLGYVEKEFEIVPKSMTNNDITVTIPSQTWTDNELTPVITVKDGQTVLTENTDYTVTAPSGPVEDSGNYTYTITGMGNYSDSREATFTITPYLADQAGAVYVYQDQNGKTALLDGTSVEDIVNCPEFTAQKVTYTRTFTTPKATIVLPFAVSQEDADAAGTFYKFYNVSSEFHVQMQQVKTGGLEAGVPYIVVPKNTTDPVTFETTTPVAFPLTEPSEFTGNSTKWTFNGRYSTKIFNTLDANELVYFFAANEQDNAKLGDFVKVAASETTRILPFRAYIRCADKTALTRGNGVTRGFPATLPVYAIGNDGNETTQIGTISIEMDDDDWYSLDGRKLSGKPNKKGLYIHKGNKVVIK